MTNLFAQLPAETFSRRRLRVMAAMESGILILPAAPRLKRSREHGVPVPPGF